MDSRKLGEISCQIIRLLCFYADDPVNSKKREAQQRQSDSQHKHQ